MPYQRHFDWHMCQDHIDNINIITDQMWRYFVGVLPPPSKKMKSSEEKMKIQRLYEISKPKRAFNPNWKVGHPLLGIIDEELGSSTLDASSMSSQASMMICMTCCAAGKIDPTILAKNSFASGSQSFKLKSIRSMKPQTNILLLKRFSGPLRPQKNNWLVKC